MAGRVLGMGDVLSFVEKVQEVVSIDQLIVCYLYLFIFLMDHGLVQLLLKCRSNEFNFFSSIICLLLLSMRSP